MRLAQTAPSSENLGQLAIVAFLGIVGSFIVGKVASVLLKNRHFDELFAVPWKPVGDGQQSSSGWRASTVVGWALFLTGIVGLIWGLSQHHGYSHLLIDRTIQFCSQAWMLLLTILVALAIARVVAAAVISVFQNQTVRNQLELFCPHSETKNSTEGDHASTTEIEPVETEASESEASESEAVKKTLAGFANETIEPESANPEPVAPLEPKPASQKTAVKTPEAFADSLARIVGLFVYLIVFLPVFMIAAELWNWTATGAAISEIWKWMIPLAGLAAVILLGWFALTATVFAVIPAKQRKPVMIATTLLALLLLVASYNTIFAIIFAVGLVVAAWVTRNDFPDAMAGWYLQAQSKLTAKTPQGAGNIIRIQLLTSDLVTVNGSFRVRNRHILRSYLDGAMIAEIYMIQIDEK